MQHLRRKELLDKIKKTNAYNFDDICLELFRYQIQNNQLYADFIQLLGIRHKDITIPQQIPFLPISFFKTKYVKSENWQEETVFKSSGTTGMSESLHFVRDKNFYLKNCEHGFSKFYGNPSDYAVLALLPSYLERDGSSLILMAEYFISLSKYPQSGFFLYDMEQLKKRLMECMAQHIPVLLLGVSFALLDFAEYCSMPLNNVIVMETGGMKGRRKELLRVELHTILKEAFKIDKIHSEYGMTELMSQAYSKGNGIFYPSNTLRVFIRDSSDPLCMLPAGKSGAVSLVDLANIDTCAFIATDDIGKVHNDGSFEIIGRFDASDIRGCNLLIG